MIVLHEAKRIDNQELVKGFLTKMWGSYHIISEDNENTAYPVVTESIKPCLNETDEFVRATAVCAGICLREQEKQGYRLAEYILNLTHITEEELHRNAADCDIESIKEWLNCSDGTWSARK